MILNMAHLSALILWFLWNKQLIASLALLKDEKRFVRIKNVDIITLAKHKYKLISEKFRSVFNYLLMIPASSPRPNQAQ